jgi:hypothetical protein
MQSSQETDIHGVRKFAADRESQFEVVLPAAYFRIIDCAARPE